MATQSGPAPKGVVGSVVDLGQAADQAIARAGGDFLTKVELQALPPAKRMHGMLCWTFEGPGCWLYDSESSAGASSTVLVPVEAPATGRWVSV